MVNTDTNIVYVGSKSVRTYSEAVLVQFEERNSPEVVIKTRGKYIVTAVNTLEFLKRKYKDIKVKSIETGSEVFKDKETNKDINVSTITITLIK